jgi:hypothetical protein
MLNQEKIKIGPENKMKFQNQIFFLRAMLKENNNVIQELIEQLKSDIKRD